jgi:hypothetical protein
MEAFSHIIFDLEMEDGRGCPPFFFRVRLPVASIILGSIPGGKISMSAAGQFETFEQARSRRKSGHSRISGRLLG